jgi:5-methylthioadenosine/S-adenosylhomocysteine deaminase
MSMLIHGALVLRESLKAHPADLLVEDGTIRAVQPPGAITDDNLERIDARNQLLVPGLVNAHTHSHGALGKGLIGDRVPLEVFLSGAGAVNGSRNLEDKRLSATLSAVELVRKGCTAAFDLFVEIPSPTRDGLDAVAEAYATVGMRAVIAPMMADRTLYQALPGLIESLPAALQGQVRQLATTPFETSIAACRDILQHWAFDRARHRPALGPTIPLHCSDAFLVACRDLAREYDVPMQTHLAETKTQAVLGLKKLGRSLTRHLEELGFLGPTCSAAHGIWLDDDDIARLAATGTSVVHNPMSNLRIGSGVAAARQLLSAGVRLGIGTDASNTSDGQNMFEALRLAAFLSRLCSPDTSEWLGAEDVFRAATRSSAEILGFDTLGVLEPGYGADIVFLDLQHINYVPLRDALLQVVFAENGAAIDSVMIDGRFVLRHGRMITVDEARLRAQAAEAVARLDQANAPARHQADAVADLVGRFCLGQARLPFAPHRRLPDDQKAGNGL